MKRRSIVLFLSSLFALASCNNVTNNDTLSTSNSTITNLDTNSNSSTVNEEKFINKFYEDINALNFRIYDDEISQTFFGEEAILYDVKNQDSYGIAKVGEQGIFEFHLLENGNPESHGMLSPNYELSALNFSYNFSFFREIKISKWIFNSVGEYYINVTNVERNILNYTGLFNKVDFITKLRIILKNDGYSLNGEYQDGSVMSFKIDNIAKCKNEKIINFCNSTLEKQTSWNSYQRKAIDYYGFWDVPFFETYTLGLKIYFDITNVQGTSVISFIAQDYLLGKDGEEKIANELENTFHYKKHHSSDENGIKVYYASYDKADYDLYVSFKYVPLNDIVEKDRIAFPNGYMQVVYSALPAEVDYSLEELNSQLNELNIPALSLDNDKYTRIFEISYKEIQNQQIMESEEIKAELEAVGLEVGPFFEEYFEINILSADREYMGETLDNFISNLKEKGYVVGYGNENYKDSSILDTPNGAISYELYDENKLPEMSIDMYLDTSNDLSWNGCVQIIVTKYSELAKEFLFTLN